jgi:hypothetical protein
MSLKRFNWTDIPPVINCETIARETGWPLERFMAYLDGQKKEFLRVAPDFGDELYPEELIFRWVRPLQARCWPIILTDKRILYKIADSRDAKSMKKEEIRNHWYVNITEVKPVWTGDIGSHIEGGGGYVTGWVWNGTGGAWGQQNPIQAVQHIAECWVTISEQSNSWRFPFRFITNQNDVNVVKDFVDMLRKLVNITWKSQSPADSTSKNSASDRNQKQIESTRAGDDTLSTLERYAALREKGLITEEEYNQQKKKLLNS